MSSQKCYVDNAYNRKLGRVGMPHGTHVVHKDGTQTLSSYNDCTTSHHTYGYNRSVPSRPNSSSSSSSARTVSVSGYYRSNGTYVSGYTRSAPKSSSSLRSSYTTVQDSGYASSYTSGYTSGASSQKCYVDNAYNRKLGRVGMPHGTHVVHRDGTQSISSVPATTYKHTPVSKVSTYQLRTTSQLASHRNSTRTMTQHAKTTSPSTTVTQQKRIATQDTGATGQKCYVDNAYNRKLGRVGKPIGTHVVHKDGSQSIVQYPSPPTTTTYYTPANTVHLRTAPPLPCTVPKPRRRAVKQRELLGRYTAEELGHFLGNLGFTRAEQATRTEYQNAIFRLEREAVQEGWSEIGIRPSTNVAILSTLQSSPSPRKIIPFKELRLEKVVGRGGFGEVFAGLWHQTPIAYKKLLLQRLSKKRKESFEIEVTILASLTHPNIVKMFGVVNEVGNCGIVMEYLIRSLFQAVFIDETNFSEAKKMIIVNQIVVSLSYLHAYKDKTIAHGDLKSENILLDKDDNVKLADFGLSALKNATESSRSAVAGVTPGQGTPRYSAPEVLRGEILAMKQLLQADIYSLGITIFELLAEEEAYENLNVRQLEANVGRGNTRPPTDEFSRPVARLLKCCWAKDAKDRPTAPSVVKEWNNIFDLYDKTS